MKPTIPYFLLLIVFVFACKKELRKEPNTTVTGTVLDFDTKLPIPNVTVTLQRYKCVIKDLLAGCSRNKTTNIKSVYADANGIFTLSFYKDDDRAYGLSLEDEGYRTHTIGLEYFNLQNDDKIYMHPK